MSIASEIERLQNAKASIKTSIENKGVTVPSSETLDEYSNYIDSIASGGTDTSDATLSSNSELLSGVTAYSKGTKYTGSMANKGSKTFTPSTSQQTDTAGYYSSVTVNAMPNGALNNPIVNSSTGVVTASVGTSGYLASGTSSTLQLTTQSAQTITPTTSNQTIASGKYLTGTQTISGDANLVAENIKKNTTIFGVTGSYEGGSSATLITKSITENGTYNASSDNADGYSQVTVSVSGGIVEPEEKDVNYYDYDGTRIYSYTKAEFLALVNEPTNPSHTGLTAQGWNWSLSDAQTYVTTYGELDIGQNYITDDENTRLYIELPEGLLSPVFACMIAGSATLDWGDGTTETITGSSGSRLQKTHTYSSKGNYIITIKDIGNSSFTIEASGSTGGIISYGSSSNPNNAYKNCLKKVELGKKVVMGSNAFNGFKDLETITIPNYLIFQSSTSNVIANCAKLKCVVVPASTTVICSNCFYGNSTMKRCILPRSITKLSTGCLSWCYCLRKINISDQITNIEGSVFAYDYNISKLILPNKNKTLADSCFANCSGLVIFDFSHYESVQSISSYGVFTSLPVMYKVWVPSALYNDWVSAPNWSDISSHIEAK